MPEEKINDKAEDGVDIHVGGDFAEKMFKIFLKYGLGPLAAAGLSGFGVHQWHILTERQAPMEVSMPSLTHDRLKNSPSIAVLEAKVISLDQHQIETDHNVNEIKMNLAHMDGKLDGILQAVKAQQ